MNGLTANEATEMLQNGKTIEIDELAGIQLALFESLLLNYVTHSHPTKLENDFILETDTKFLPEVLDEIHERGFQIEVHIVQAGKWHHYHNYNSIYATYDDFMGYRFSF